MYRLTFPSPAGRREPVTADTGSLVIGRAEGCGLRLSEAGVRDRHAVIERRPDGYHIRDLANSGSVRVNSKPVTDVRLASGDEVELGAVQFVFEMVHQPPPGRRSFDLWQAVAMAGVAALLVGQVAVFGWIFSQPHPRTGRTDIVKPRAAKKEASTPTTPALPSTLNALEPLVPATPTPQPPAPPATPEVLARRLRVMRVERKDSDTGMDLRLLVKAQVGQRELDTSTVQISIACYTASSQPPLVHWARIPAAWENFGTQQFTVRCPPPAAQYVGYVVRTYHQQQLQDVHASTPALAAHPAPPLP